MDPNIKKIIFYGIIAFTQRQSKNSNIKFDEDSYLSGRLGVNENIPLFRFCYDYIVFQMESESEIRKSLSYYTDYMKKGKWNSGKDKDLIIVKNFYIETEAHIIEALSNIPQKIKNGAIPFYDYGVIANFIVAIRYDAEIEFDIESIIAVIIDSLQSISENVDFESLFGSGIELADSNGIDEYKIIRQRMKEALTGVNDSIEFPYTHSALENYYHKLTKDALDELRQKGFAHKIDNQKFVSMLKICTPKEISIIRSLFMDIYRDKQYSMVLEEDIKSLPIIRDSVSVLKEYKEYNKIQKLQIKWLVKNLSDMIRGFEVQKITGSSRVF